MRRTSGAAELGPAREALLSAEQVSTPDLPSPAQLLSSSPIRSSQGQRSASVSGMPCRIFSTLAGGCSRSPSMNGQPSFLASSSATVVLPLPDTPMTTKAVPFLAWFIVASRGRESGRARVRLGDRLDLAQPGTEEEDGEEQHNPRHQERERKGIRRADNEASDRWRDRAHEIVEEVHHAANRACSAPGGNE